MALGRLNSDTTFDLAVAMDRDLAIIATDRAAVVQTFPYSIASIAVGDFVDRGGVNLDQDLALLSTGGEVHFLAESPERTTPRYASVSHVSLAEAGFPVPVLARVLDEQFEEFQG